MQWLTLRVDDWRHREHPVVLVVDDGVRRGVPDDMKVPSQMPVVLHCISRRPVQLRPRSSIWGKDGRTHLVDPHQLLGSVLRIPVEGRKLDLLRIPAHVSADE